MAAALSFRRADLSDAEGIAALVNGAYRGEASKAGWTTEADLLGGQRTDAGEVAGLIAAADSVILLGHHAGRLVASAHLEKSERTAYLGMFAVRPSQQNTGVGKRMIAATEAFAMREWHAAKMCMLVITLRHELIAYYERRGYSRTGQLQAFPSAQRFGIPKVPELWLETLEKPLRHEVSAPPLMR